MDWNAYRIHIDVSIQVYRIIVNSSISLGYIAGAAVVAAAAAPITFCVVVALFWWMLFGGFFHFITRLATLTLSIRI